MSKYIPTIDELVAITFTCHVFNLDDHKNPGDNVLTACIKSIQSLNKFHI